VIIDFLLQNIRDLNFCYVLYNSRDKNQKIYLDMILNGNKIFDIFKDANYNISNFMYIEYNEKPNTLIYKQGKRLKYIKISDIQFLKSEFKKSQHYFFEKFSYLNN